MKSSFQPARLSFSVSDPLLLSSRATSSARRRMSAMFAGPLSLRLRAASDGLDHPPVAMQRIGGDNLALEINEPNHLERGIDLVAVLGRHRGKREAQASSVGRDHHSRRALLAFFISTFQ